jgi:hypothetical protein
MSRYRADPRYSAGDLAYRDPPTQRWDTDRFARERDYRAPPVIEQRPPYDDPYRPPRRAPVYEREQYYEDDIYGPRGNLRERRIYEEDDVYRDPRAAGGAMVPFRPERPSRPEPVPRPGILRRQSSLDTFDRRPSRRYDDNYGPPPGPPARPRYDYDDVRVQDPDRWGDEGFREYREREWITRRRRSGSRSRSRSRDRGSAFEEVREEIREEKTYPRRGKTRMPKRLVHTKVLYDLGYPYYEEVGFSLELPISTLIADGRRMRRRFSSKRLSDRRTSTRSSPCPKSIASVKVSRARLASQETQY